MGRERKKEEGLNLKPINMQRLSVSLQVVSRLAPPVIAALP